MTQILANEIVIIFTVTSKAEDKFYSWDWDFYISHETGVIYVCI